MTTLIADLKQRRETAKAMLQDVQDLHRKLSNQPQAHFVGDYLRALPDINPVHREAVLLFVADAYQIRVIHHALCKARKSREAAPAVARVQSIVGDGNIPCCEYCGNVKELLRAGVLTLNIPEVPTNAR